MIYEITNTAGDIELNKWYMIHDIKGEVINKDACYIRFVFAWHLDGQKLYKLPAGETIMVEMEFNDTSYP